jgi:AraC family transcriptional regulator
MNQAIVATPDSDREVGELAPILMKLLRTAIGTADSDPQAAKRFMSEAFSLLEVQSDRLSMPPSNGSLSGGLTPWQIRRVTRFVDQNLDDRILISDLSDVVRLSANYFSRAFRHSFGETPHAYLVRRRLEYARNLMLTTELALSEVAQASGFSDQAHLCRQFRHSEGCSPAAWRRERKVPKFHSKGAPLANQKDRP